MKENRERNDFCCSHCGEFIWY